MHPRPLLNIDVKKIYSKKRKPIALISEFLLVSFKKFVNWTTNIVILKDSKKLKFNIYIYNLILDMFIYLT
jgi:hypothetical protein